MDSRILDELEAAFGQELALVKDDLGALETAVQDKLRQLDPGTVRQMCLKEGMNVLSPPAEPAKLPKGQDLVGSCDGTMVHIRQDGWRELKAYRFEHSAGSAAGAFLEPAERFLPRLRKAAIALDAGKAI